MSHVISALRITVLSLSIVSAVGCGPSAKNEEQYWTNNQATIAELGSRWPGFKGLLAARLEKARPAWEPALKVGDEKERAQKMQAANGLVADGLLKRLDEVKYKSRGIEDTVGKINALKLPVSRSGERQEAVASARRSVAEVERAMVAARPANEEEALKVLEENISTLIADGGAADRAYKRLKPEPEKAKKKK